MVLPTSFTLKPHFFKRALHLQRRTILQRGRCQRYAYYMLCIHFLMNSRFNSLGKNIIKEQRTYRSLGARRGSKAIFTNHGTLHISVQGSSTVNISMRMCCAYARHIMRSIFLEFMTYEGLRINDIRSLLRFLEFKYKQRPFIMGFFLIGRGMRRLVYFLNLSVLVFNNLHKCGSGME